MNRSVLLGAALCVGIAFQASAEEVRSKEVLRVFQRANPCPSTHLTHPLVTYWTDPSGATHRSVHQCPGYVIDHICPLSSCGGADEVGNLQWQTIAAGEAKDRWERTPRGCSLLCGAPE